MPARRDIAVRMATQMVQKYARKDGYFSRLLRNPSALARFLRNIGDVFSSKPVSEREVQAAMEIARRVEDVPVPEHDIESLPRADLIRRRQLGDMLMESEQEILIPGSSNVYSISYTPESRTRGILYVTYRHGKPTHKVKRVNSCTGQQYNMGVKPFTKGPTYAYFDVPIIVFNRLKSARSTGEEIWNSLRICGTVYGHQYRYTLMEGARIGPNPEDVYVPRRATPRGFASRSVALTGQFSGASGGVMRRRFVGSTLPAERRSFRGTSEDVHAGAARRFRGG